MNPRYRPLAATTLIFVIAYAICISQYPGMWSTRVFGNFLTDNAFLGIAAVGATFRARGHVAQPHGADRRRHDVHEFLPHEYGYVS